MDETRVQSQDGVTLVGAGYPRPEDIEEALNFAPTLVAADGGGGFALSAGFEPVRVFGDMDSLDTDTRAQIGNDRIVEIAEQDSTDFEKALSRIDAPFVLATGFTAGRVDHTLAVCRSLVRRIGPRTIVFGADDVIFAAPRQIALDLPIGSRLSLFPMAAVTGRSRGLFWPIEGLAFHPSGQIGTSNKVSGPVDLSFDGPGMLIILPREALRTVLEALTE